MLKDRVESEPKESQQVNRNSNNVLCLGRHHFMLRKTGVLEDIDLGSNANSTTF
jgi:hypothetical protein